MAIKHFVYTIPTRDDGPRLSGVLYLNRVGLASLMALGIDTSHQMG